MGSLMFIKRLFKRNQTEKGWIIPLFHNIEMIHEQKLVVPFKIVDMKKGLFIIKVKGLYACVPFDYMPWNYSHIGCWKAVSSSLMGKWFYGKIYQIHKSPDKRAIAQIYVDATATITKKANLECDIDYSGIVLHKTAHSVLVDIGFHFKWECGSYCGFLPNYYFPDFESLKHCKSGDILIVNYDGEDEEGLIFKKKESVNLHLKYIGKTIQVKVNIDEKGGLELMAEDKYKAIMPFTTDIYGDEKKIIQDMRKYWQRGEIIECSVLGVNNITQHFFVKYLPNRDSDLYRQSQIVTEYFGKTIPVMVFRDERRCLSFMAEEKYKVVVPVTTEIYGEEKSTIQDMMKYWQDGEIIECCVLGVNSLAKLFVVEYLPNRDSDLYLQSQMRVGYVGKATWAKIYKNENGGDTLMMEDRYRAVMPVSKVIYGKEKNTIKEIMKYWQDGEIIDCYVLNLNCFTQQFVLKYLPNHDLEFYLQSQIKTEHIDKTIQVDFDNDIRNGEDITILNQQSNTAAPYVGKRTWVKVCKTELGYQNFYIEDKYLAIMPIKDAIYGKKRKTIENIQRYWQNGDIFDCYVMDYNRDKQYVIKFLSKKDHEIDWNSQEVNSYVGKTVKVYLYKTALNNAMLLVDNKYRAMPAGAFGCLKKFNKLPVGTILDGIVESVDAEYGQFLIGCNPHNTLFPDADTPDVSVESSTDTPQKIPLPTIETPVVKIQKSVRKQPWIAPQNKYSIGQMVDENVYHQLMEKFKNTN